MLSRKFIINNGYDEDEYEEDDEDEDNELYIEILNNYDCPVCNDIINQEENVYLNCCKTVYCMKCLGKLLMKDNNCVICKKKIGSFIDNDIINEFFVINIL